MGNLLDSLKKKISQLVNMRSAVKALLVFAVLLFSGAESKPASSNRKINRIRPVVESLRVVRNLDEVKKIKANNNDETASASLVSLTDEEIRKQVAEHPDRPAVLTDDVIYSDKTKFVTYTEDDGDVHIAIRIPGSKNKPVLGSDEENVPNPDFPEEKDEEEVVNPKIDVIEETDKGADDSNVDVTPPIMVVNKESDSEIDYVDPDKDNQKESSTENNRNTKTETDVKVGNGDQPKEGEEENSNSGITNIEYEDPEAENPEKNRKENESVPEDEEPKPAPAPGTPDETKETSTQSTTKTAAPKEETTDKENSLDQMISLTKGIESGGLSLFWIFAILFCCFI